MMKRRERRGLHRIGVSGYQTIEVSAAVRMDCQERRGIGGFLGQVDQQDLLEQMVRIVRQELPALLGLMELREQMGETEFPDLMELMVHQEYQEIVVLLVRLELQELTVNDIHLLFSQSIVSFHTHTHT